MKATLSYMVGLSISWWLPFKNIRSKPLPFQASWEIIYLHLALYRLEERLSLHCLLWVSEGTHQPGVALELASVVHFRVNISMCGTQLALEKQLQVEKTPGGQNWPGRLLSWSLPDGDQREMQWRGGEKPHSSWGPLVHTEYSSWILSYTTIKQSDAEGSI